MAREKNKAVKNVANNFRFNILVKLLSVFMLPLLCLIRVGLLLIKQLISASTALFISLYWAAASVSHFSIKRLINSSLIIDRKFS